MNPTVDAASHLAELRVRAATRLHGDPGAADAPGRSAAAMGVLQTMASAPASAADALAVLHELQVHQVELDLQAEELRDGRAAVEAALQRQLALHDALPVACLTIDREFIVHAINRAGARLFGLAAPAACPLRLDRHLDVPGAQALQAAFERLSPEGDGVSVSLQIVSSDGTAREVQARLQAEPGGPRGLLVLVDGGPRTRSHGPG